MEKTILRPRGVWKSAPFAFSQGVKVSGRTMVFVSGQSSQDVSGKVVGESFEAQTIQTFKNMKHVLHEADASFDNVVKLNVYFTDLNDLPKYEEIVAAYFPNGFPAQTVVEVKKLARRSMKIEVEAIAIL